MPIPTSWTIEFSSGIPIYRQIENLILAEARSGKLQEGDRLPTIRELADHFNINPNTVAKAYRDLDLQGVVESRRGDGSFVAAQSKPAARLSKSHLAAKCDELLERMFSEARALGITKEDILNRIKPKATDQ